MIGLLRSAGAFLFGGRRSRESAPPRLSPSARTGDNWGGVFVPAGEAAIPWLGPYTPWDIPIRVKKIMRRSTQIKIGERALRAPFRGITYRVTGGDPRARAFVSETFLKRPVLHRAIRSILNAMPFGFQAHEIRWALEDVVIDEDGPGGLSPRVVPRAYVIRDIVDLDPERVLLCRDEWGDPDGLEFDGQFLGEDQVAIASFLPEFQNWYGTSILEGAYEPWFEAQHTKKHHEHWNEQKSNPPYVGYAPDDDSLAQEPDKALSGQGRSPVQVIARAAMSLRQGGVCALPAAFDDSGNRLWELKEIETQNRTGDFLAHRRYLDDMQLRGMFVPERTVSQEGVGSYAMADAHVGVFLGMMEETRVDLVIANLQKFVDRIVRVNFGRAARAPRVESSELNRQSKALLASIVEKTLDVKRVTAEGVPYTTAEILDDIAALEALNIPHHKPRDVNADAEGGGSIDVQSTAFNGAQIQALQALVASVGANELPAQTAIEAIVAGFPTISRIQAEAMVLPAQTQAAATAAAASEVAQPTAEQLARFNESAADVGARYKVRAATVRKWGRSAPADCVLPLPGGRYRFCGSKLDAWIASGAPPTEAEMEGDDPAAEPLPEEDAA